MKKIICILFVVLIIMSSSAAFAEEQQIGVYVGSNLLEFNDQPPVMVNDRVLVPLRAIFEALGARVHYDEETMLITAKRNLTTVELTVGSDKLYVNGKENVIDVPAFVQNGRTLVPVRAVSEALGVAVYWDEEFYEVNIDTLYWEHYSDIESIVEEYDYNGKKVKIECYYPQLLSKESSILKLNEKLKSDAEKYVDDVKNSVDNYEETELNFARDYCITYDFNGSFSYIVQSTVNNSDLQQSSLNVYVDTLEDIKISDLELDIKDEEFVEGEVYEEDITEGYRFEFVDVFTDYINANPGIFYDNALDIVNKVEKYDFYFTEKGFSYFVNPGVLAHKDKGIITVDVNY